MESEQTRQKVHSQEQMRASALSCGSAVPQRSHFSRISSAIDIWSLSGRFWHVYLLNAIEDSSEVMPGDLQVIVVLKI